MMSERNGRSGAGEPDYQVLFNGRTYYHLGPRPESAYRQFFYKKKKIFAQTLHRATLGPGGRAPEVVAADYGVPVEAVMEAIAFCEENPDVPQMDHETTEASIRAAGRDRPALAATHPDPNA